MLFQKQGVRSLTWGSHGASAFSSRVVRGFQTLVMLEFGIWGLFQFETMVGLVFLCVLNLTSQYIQIGKGIRTVLQGW